MDIFEQCIKWDVNRNLKEFNAESEYNMLKEELDEFDEATLGYYYDADGYQVQYTEDEIERLQVDALCDLIKVSISGIHKLGYSPKLAMLETLQEINSRQQDPLQAMSWRIEGPDGKWKKDTEQDPSTLYKADYSDCKYKGDL